MSNASPRARNFGTASSIDNPRVPLNSTGKCTLRAEVGTYVGAFFGESQKVYALKLVQRCLGNVRSQIPQALHLRLGQRQTWHLDIFGTDQIHAVISDDLATPGACGMPASACGL